MSDVITSELYAKKILKKRLMFFSYYTAEDKYDDRLGKYFGYYENNQNGNDRLHFYDLGICWEQKNKNTTIFYKNIKSHRLEDGKSSLALLIDLNDGSTTRLPVKGRRDKFVDSLQVHTFLGSVLGRVYKVNEIADGNT